ncbi:leucine--tRNA ligase [Cellulomonas sp. Y8]|uniref:leucine--tRNA ligase n=1 Tax=Cellulomonas sp. Y8 TaxID=2591145 RepID=UPI0035278AD3
MTSPASTQPDPASVPATAGGQDVPFRYTAELAQQIELRWQDEWVERGTFFAANPAGSALTDGDGASAREGARPFFVMDMFPYPSGAGLHVGHPLGYIATDVVARFRRMQGDNVLHALGYDAFGLPAEQYAVQTGQHPRTTTEANIEIMARQLKRLGVAHDPRRSFATIDPDYVRWTQWIFLQIFESWYDEDAVRPDGGRGAARPVSTLVEAYESGARAVPDGVEGVEAGAAWADLDEVQRRRVVDGQRLAYVSETPVNWCPGLGTVLANEEVTSDGRSERGNFPVFQRTLRQWNMRITAYADRLADDLSLIDWPEKVTAMQRNWIGRSEGAHVDFEVTDADEPLTVFTTRPDTLFGATYVVLAPEHPLVDAIVAESEPSWDEDVPETWRGGASSPAEAVAAYRREAAAKTAVERQADAGRKTGVFTGGYALNPVNGAQLPVFIADYVLMGYGTGAIMAVPGGDTRDFAFAEAFGLPVVHTVQPPEGHEGAWTGDGAIINSSNDEISLDGLSVAEAKTRIVDWLAERGAGSRTTTYRLRDWLFSRQRYWGEPFPIVYDENDLPIAIPEQSLPVDLPDVPDYAPRTFDPDDANSSPEAPLSRNDDWVNVTLDLGDGPKVYRRDTNTMPNWAGSCWYYLHYLDPQHATGQVVDPALEQYWMGPGHNPGDTHGAGGVDLYVGGVEHAVLHLLYARFWHKALYDLGHVSSREPFYKLFNQGYIQAYAYTDVRGVYVPAAEVVEDESVESGFTWNGEEVFREYGKIGKSLKNAVSPDEMYAEYGADTLRVYEMSMGPLDLSRPWETRAVVGAQRFLQRVWRNVVSEETGAVTVVDEEPAVETLRVLHRTIAEVGEDMQAMRINTAIAKLIVLNNHLTSLPAVPRTVAEQLVLMTAPVAPHLAEELWSRLGHERSLAHEPFPAVDPQYLVQDSVTCVFQVQGKVRGRAEVAPDADEATLRELALADPGVQRAMAGRDVRTVIVRAPKLVNVVPA